MATSAWKSCYCAFLLVLIIAFAPHMEGSPAVSSENIIRISDRSGSTQTNAPYSLPRFFRKGEIARYAQPTINGKPAPSWQCDDKNRWPDGSLKFAIVSLVVPEIPGHRAVEVGFINSASRDSESKNSTPAGYLSKAAMLEPAYDFEAAERLSGAASHNISARAMLDAGKFRYWLRGPVVTAVIIEDREGRTYDVSMDGGKSTPLHPIFEAWFYPQNHKVEVGFTIENSWASSDPARSARNQDYSLTLTTGFASPVTRLNQPTFTHYAFTRWRRSYWIGSDPPAARYDWNARYLLSTGMYPNFDTSSTGDANAIAGSFEKYEHSHPARFSIPGGADAPGQEVGIGNFDRAIDAGGDAEWIGLADTWDILNLLTGEPRKAMIDNADLVGRFPMWFREADEKAGSGKFFDAPNGHATTQGRVVSVNARPQGTLQVGNFRPDCITQPADLIHAPGPPNTGGWPALDTSHMGDVGYLPYTLTGKYYYLEQLQMQAAYTVAFYTGCFDLSNDYYRQGSLALFTRWTRDQAWALRTVAYAAVASPDEGPEAPYFRDKLLNTLAMFEGAHALPNDYPDRRVAYNWGKTTWQSSQARDPSPLGAWQVDSASLAYAENGKINNVNPAMLRAAGSNFQEPFLICTLGMIRQLGLADTKPLLTFLAKRYFHTLLDPSVNHYLIEEYVYPQRLKSPDRWVPDWKVFQSAYLVLPSGWSGADKSGNVRGFYNLAAVSYLTDITVDGYSGRDAWNWFKRNKPYRVYNPRWNIVPFQP